VLVYESAPLDADLTVVGPVGVSLHVSTTGTDADWVVKLIDVFPDETPDPSPNPARVRMGGYHQLVRGEPFRGKFRTGFGTPQAFVPARPTRVRFTMPDVNHRFLAGHRVMVQVQSSWFPLVDRNPQKFVPNIYFAQPEDFQKATHRVYRSTEHPTSVRLGVLSGEKQ
jgi:putative CocE/NonD family hydrolase